MEENGIPRLQPYDENDVFYEQDPMLKYIAEVANKFWMGFDGYSEYPRKFVERMEQGKIEWHDEWWQAYLHGKELQQSLELFGIDTLEKKAQFFYLCLMVKDYALTSTQDALTSEPTPRERIQKLIDALNYLKPKQSIDGFVFGCEGEGKIEYTYQKEKKRKKETQEEYYSHYVIDDIETLYYMKLGLEQFLRSNPQVDNPLDMAHVPFWEGGMNAPKKHFFFLFYKHIYWFLQQQEKVLGRYGDADRNLMVSRMVYYIGISNDPQFLETEATERDTKPILGKDGYYKRPALVKAKKLKGIISSVKEQDIKTHSTAYWN